MANLSPFGPQLQYEDSAGKPAVGYRLFFFVNNSVGTKQDTYTTAAGTVANTNPIVLNALGQPANGIFFPAGQAYTIQYAPPGSDDPPNSPIWTRNDVYGVNDVTATQDQWVASGVVPTYVSATSFTLPGDQTSTFQIGRRVKTTNSGGTVYSTITASAYGALTTVTVVNDSGTLDSGLSAVSYGLLSKLNDSIPRLIFPTMPQVQKYIAGLTYANNVSDATNDIDIAAGTCIDATGVYPMTLASTLTKRSDAAWAVGTGNGWLDTGAIGNNDYYIWIIARSDTGVVDSLLSLSSTAPTMPSNYDYKRLIGWIKRSGGAIVAFHTYELAGGGIHHQWDVPTLDVNLANTLTTARRTDAVKVPLNVTTEALLNVVISDASAGSFNWICCPDQTDAAPSGTAAPLNCIEAATGVSASRQINVLTSATGTIAARSTLATVDLYAVSTMGFKWARRN